MEIIPPETNPLSRGSHQARINNRLPSKPDAAQEIKCPYYMDISNAGKSRNIISGMRGDGKNEVLSFRQELRQKIQSGNFNAAEMADNAPERLKAWAEKTGVELEDVLNPWEDKARAITEKYSTMPYTQNTAGRPHFHRHLHGAGSAESRFSLMSNINAEDRAELRAFKQEVRQAIQEGTFNAEELAEKAPAALKTWTEENGMNVEEMLTRRAEKAAQIEGKFSTMPYAMGWPHHHWYTHSVNAEENRKIMMSYLSEEGKVEFQTFRQKVRQAIQDGTFNAEELAGKAPAELTVWAEEYGIDLIEKLNQLAERAAEINEKLASPPENKDEESPADSLIEHILIDYLTLELENTFIDMSEDDKSAIQSLDQEIHQGIQDGTFNTADLVEKIPVGLRSWAEENGIELEEALNQWAGIGAVPEEPPATDTVS